MVRKRMINCLSYVRFFPTCPDFKGCDHSLVHWRDEWLHNMGEGISIGLLDTGIDREVIDFRGSKITIRNFVKDDVQVSAANDHGTFSAAVLVGQGIDRISGLVPRSHLFIANVVESAGTVEPSVMREALGWLIQSHVHFIAIPLGSQFEYDEIAQKIIEGHKRNITFLAAAGNTYPKPVLFPARNPFVIAVGGVDNRCNILPDCCRFPRLDLLVPAFRITAPISSQTISSRSGSSVACVVAAGIAALMRSSKKTHEVSSRSSILEQIVGKKFRYS